MGAHLCCLLPCHDRYVGDWNGNRRHGRGVYTFANGSTYSGTFVNNKREGHGVLVDTAHERTYDGDWRDDRQDGDGVLRGADGGSEWLFIGKFQRGMRVGHGTLIRADGRVYSGSWRDDVECGYGELSYKSGQLDVGEFARGALNGSGIRCAANGDMFDGLWEDGNLHGDAVWYKARGDIISGRWSHGRLSAPATVKSAIAKGEMTTELSGDVYSGAVNDDGVPDGAGSIAFANGDTWSGTMSAGRPLQLNCHFKYAGGDIYDGEMNTETSAAMAPHGIGTKRFVDGSMYSGCYQHGMRNGEGTMLYANGDVYTGDWQNDRRHGHGVLSLHDGVRYEGGWMDDVQEGRGVLYYQTEDDGDDDGDCFVSEWRRGVPVDRSNNLRVAAIRILRSRIDRLSVEYNELVDKERALDPKELCRICERRLRNTILLECGHRAVCGVCGGVEEELLDGVSLQTPRRLNRCPLCHEQVTRVVITHQT